MKVGKSGWLEELLQGAVAQHTPPLLSPELASLPPRARARAHIRHMLRASGLRYGTPTSPPPAPGTSPAAVPTEPPSGSPEERLFVAVLRAFVSLALDTAVLVGAPAGKRQEQLLVLFAALTGLTAEAAELDRKIAALAALPRRTVAKVESTLAERAISLAGDPVYGLVLHNGAVWVDAQCFGFQATDYFVSGRFSHRRAERRLELAAREKAVLVEVLTALACAERRPSYSARRAILRQIEDLKLPERYEQTLKERAKRFFDRRPSLKSLVPEIRSEDARRFILEQTVLSSLVEGRRSPKELVFLRDLTDALRFSPEDAKQVEVGVAEFYAANRSLVDVFTVSAGASVMGEELMESMQRTAEKNFHRLMREAKKTGELSVLLTQAARGRKLSNEEKKRVRGQLMEVAKTIPALAIFAAPGGLLLLAALAKVLPANVLPSVMVAEEPEQTDPFAKALRRR